MCDLAKFTQGRLELLSLDSKPGAVLKKDWLDEAPGYFWYPYLLQQERNLNFSNSRPHWEQ